MKALSQNWPTFWALSCMVTDNYCNVRTLSRSSICFLQVAVLIDTSASMASRLFLVKDKLYRLMQVHTSHFTAIHFVAVLEIQSIVC